MKLVDDFRGVLRRAWSVRLALVSAVLSAAEVLLGLVMPDHPPLWLAGLASAVALAAALARIVAQPALRSEP